MDLHDITEHIVPDKPAPTGFRQDDLILQAEEGNIAVYRIKGMGEGKVSSDVLRTYPTAKDIEDMTLVKEGELVWENSEFLNIPES
ncbi:hypothetical protein D3C73_1352460 [compost metagenome]